MQRFAQDGGVHTQIVERLDRLEVDEAWEMPPGSRDLRVGAFSDFGAAGRCSGRSSYRRVSRRFTTYRLRPASSKEAHRLEQVAPPSLTQPRAASVCGRAWAHGHAVAVPSVTRAVHSGVLEARRCRCSRERRRLPEAPRQARRRRPHAARHLDVHRAPPSSATIRRSCARGCRRCRRPRPDPPSGSTARRRPPMCGRRRRPNRNPFPGRTRLGAIGRPCHRERRRPGQCQCHNIVPPVVGLIGWSTGVGKAQHVRPVARQPCAGLRGFLGVELRGEQRTMLICRHKTAAPVGAPHAALGGVGEIDLWYSLVSAGVTSHAAYECTKNRSSSTPSSRIDPSGACTVSHPMCGTTSASRRVTAPPIRPRPSVSTPCSSPWVDMICSPTHTPSTGRSARNRS